MSKSRQKRMGDKSDTTKSLKQSKHVPAQKTGNFIGKKGRRGYRYWNPEENCYVAVEDPNRRWAWDNKMAYRRGDEGALDMCWYVNQHGTHVRGVRPSVGLHSESMTNQYGNASGEFIMHSNVGYFENPEWILDPENDTGVPRKIRNPNFIPDYKA